MSRTQRLTQPEQFGNYQLIARLSAGRLGQVYKAKSIGVEGFERVLVIKTIDKSLAAIPGFVDIIAEEAQRAVLLSHANVVQVLNLGQEELSQQPFLTMEFVHGMDLHRALKVCRVLEQPWPLELAIYVIAEVANGLDYAHRRKDYEFNKLNIMHYDVAPFNIMLSTEGEAKLSDFGLAKALTLAPVTSDDDTLRKLMYQAPEVARGEAYTQRSDLYSLGMVFYELLAGHHPYKHAASSTQHFIQLAKQGAVPPLHNRASLPRPLVQLVESMLVPDPNGRISSAGQAYEELVGFIYGNNLQRADARALGLFIQNLRTKEGDLFPEQSIQEAGIDEISLSELQVPENLLSFYGDLHPESEAADDIPPDVTSDALPRHKLQQVFMGNNQKPPSPESISSALPKKLQDLLNLARSGKGQAVILHGQMGSGRDYYPDRIAEILSQQGRTMTCAIQCLRHELFRPFGTLSDLLLSAVLPLLPEEQRNPAHAIEKLEEIKIPPRAISALKELWDIEPSDNLLGLENTRKLLSDACGAVIRHLCKTHTLVFIIDHVEHIDPLSMLVLRDITAHINKFPAMLIMSTNNQELVRRSLDAGNPQQLEQVKLVGNQERSKHYYLKQLPPDAEHIMMCLAIAQIALSQNDLLHITEWPSERLFAAIKELVERNLIRAPQPGVFLATHEEFIHWSSQQERLTSRQEIAENLAKKFNLIEPKPDPLTHLRLIANAQQRREFVLGAHTLANKLAGRGWLQHAMALYKHFSELILEANLHAPQARLNFMLARAEIAMELAMPHECQASVGPIQALAESLHDERSLIASQLLEGQLAMYQDDIDDARHHFSRALEAAHAIKDPDILANSMTYMAKWYERHGDIANAQRMIEGALNLHSRWGTQHMNLHTRAKVTNLAVNLWCYRNMPTQAQNLIHNLERLTDHTQLAQLNCRLEWAKGRLFSSMGELDTAIHTLKRAASIASYHGLTSLELDILRHLTHTMIEAKQFQQALPMLERLIHMSTQHNDLYTNLRALELRALAHLLTNQHIDGALKQLHENLSRAQQRRVPRDIYRCHSFLVKGYKHLGNTELYNTHHQLMKQAASTMRYARYAA